MTASKEIKALSNYDFIGTNRNYVHNQDCKHCITMILVYNQVMR